MVVSRYHHRVLWGGMGTDESLFLRSEGQSRMNLLLEVTLEEAILPVTLVQIHLDNGLVQDTEQRSVTLLHTGIEKLCIKTGQGFHP